MFGIPLAAKGGAALAAPSMLPLVGPVLLVTSAVIAAPTILKITAKAIETTVDVLGTVVDVTADVVKATAEVAVKTTLFVANPTDAFGFRNR